MHAASQFGDVGRAFHQLPVAAFDLIAGDSRQRSGFPIGERAGRVFHEPPIQGLSLGLEVFGFQIIIQDFAQAERASLGVALFGVRIDPFRHAGQVLVGQAPGAFDGHRREPPQGDPHRPAVDPTLHHKALGASVGHLDQSARYGGIVPVVATLGGWGKGLQERLGEAGMAGLSTGGSHIRCYAGATLQRNLEIRALTSSNPNRLNR